METGVIHSRRLHGGLPLGGIGAGTFQMQTDGGISAAALTNNFQQPTGDLNGCFAALWTRSGGRTQSRVLALTSPYGLPTVAALDFDGRPPLALLDYPDAASPARRGREPFRDRTGDAIYALPSANGFFGLRFTGPELTKGTSPAERLRDNATGEIALLCLPSRKDATVTLAGWNALEAKPGWWDGFARSGDVAGNAPIGAEGKAHPAGVISVRLTLRPNDFAEIPFSVAWRTPRYYTQSGVDYRRYDSARWADAPKAARDLLENWRSLLALTLEWQESLTFSNLPRPLVRDLINSVTPLQTNTLHTADDKFAWFSGGIFGPLSPNTKQAGAAESLLSAFFPNLQNQRTGGTIDTEYSLDTPNPTSAKSNVSPPASDAFAAYADIAGQIAQNKPEAGLAALTMRDAARDAAGLSPWVRLEASPGNVAAAKQNSVPSLAQAGAWQILDALTGFVYDPKTAQMTLNPNLPGTWRSLVAPIFRTTFQGRMEYRPTAHGGLTTFRLDRLVVSAPSGSDRKTQANGQLLIAALRVPAPPRADLSPTTVHVSVRQESLGFHLTPEPATNTLLITLDTPLDAQERAEDWNGMDETFTAIDSIAPAIATEYDRMHSALERARWLAHQNRATEAKALLRQLSESAAPSPATVASNAAVAPADDISTPTEWALQQIELEQAKLHYFDDAITTARRFPKPERVSQALYSVLWGQAQAGDKAGALQTADLTGDPLNRLQALLGLAQMQTAKGQNRQSVANRQEALQFAITLPEGKPRHDAFGMLLSEFQWSENVPDLLRLADVSSDSQQRDNARLYAVQLLWKQAKTEATPALAAQAEALAAGIKDEGKRRETARYAVTLRAWSGNAAGAKAVAARRLGKGEATLFLLVGERLRDRKNPQATKILQNLAQLVVIPLETAYAYAPSPFHGLATALLSMGEWRIVMAVADHLSDDVYRLQAYQDIALQAARAKDTACLKEVLPRLEPLIAGLQSAQDRVRRLINLADAYAALGQTGRILPLIETLPESKSRAEMLMAWGEWQAKRGDKNAKDTLGKAAKVALGIADVRERIPVNLQIMAALTLLDAKPEVTALLAQTVAAAAVAPLDSGWETWRSDLANCQAEAGDADGALQNVLKIKEAQQRNDALFTLAYHLNRSGMTDRLAPIVSALTDETARRDLLLHLVWQGKADTDDLQKQQRLALAPDDGGKASVLLSIAQKQAASKPPYPGASHAKMPPGLAKTYAQRDAARLLNTVGREVEARTLLLAAVEQIVRVMKPGKQGNWHLPPTEPYTGTRLSAENEWEVQLLDIAEAQSEAGDLEAALQTVRHLPTGQLRQFAVNENVRDWMTSGPQPHDLTALTQLTSPDERPYALLTAANALLPPVNIGL
ncbi:uncharacterized protein KY384_000080 [Bacidia gigantensis]|uniref:uncharacterized protein n=1 Tax=Bacidia gigantensis TaxID=2732470 RepID=UPI001D03AFB7|nr:uncharacterized protein KY384_000080 [Bacidia gigantensis]KAG8526088.1 hypothetical protein KY384_000080 [Bacidia gigantensis]